MISTIYMIIMGVIAILSVVNYCFANALIKAQKIKLDEMYRNDKTIIIYALMKIQEDSELREDFENAKKCQDLINVLKQLEK